MSKDKRVNIVIFGVGNVGGTLIRQIHNAGVKFRNHQQVDIKIVALANSSSLYCDHRGIGETWRSDFEALSQEYQLTDIINFIMEYQLDNLIAIDATASEGFVESYPVLIQNGFNIVAANKVANTLSTEFYETLRAELKKHGKQFLYETNVGAGLPVIQTLQDFEKSGERVEKIRGVFSGSLSYIFNSYSESSLEFDQVLLEAQQKGLTEPDPRIDLSGKDVGRKLLILARELRLRKELSDIEIEDLVPSHLNGNTTLEDFRRNEKDLNAGFEKLRSQLGKDEVIRHIGELNVKEGSLRVRLVKEKKSTALGSLKNADSSFEFYTESYGENPVVIQGAGAGAEVTARGVLTDIIKISNNLN